MSLRFCLLTTFYPPFNFGGDGIDVQRTARALTARGHQVTVVHDVDAYQWLAGRRLPVQPVDQDGVEVVGLRSRLGVVSPFLTHQFGRPVMHASRIRALISERRFDVVVFNNVSLVGGPGLLDVGGDALKVYVAHEHWLVCPTHVLWRFNREPCDRRECLRCVLSYRRPPQAWRFTDALERRLPQVDLFIARSEFSREKHREFGFTPPMAVLPYFLPGADTDWAGHAAPVRPHTRPYFLFVGRLTKLKGLDQVLQAFARYPAADLLVVGDGEERATLESRAARLPNVKFIGWVPNAALHDYYAHAIAAIVPSRGFETFGIVLIEAFRHGTPVIARRMGPFPEIIDQSRGGLLFSDNRELLAAMTRLQEDRVCRDTLADNGHRACRERWSEPVVIDRYLALIEQARRGRGVRATLTYHSIDESGSAVSISPAAFDRHLRWLAGGAIRVLSLTDLAAHRDEAGDAVAVTFDDGFASVMPAIERLLDHGITPTVFIVTAQAGGTNAWGGRPEAGIPTMPLMGWKDIEALAARGACFEAHTRTHPRLTRVSADLLDEELGGSHANLQSRLGVASAHLAYPYGDVNDHVAARARESFAYGHTVEMRALSGGSEPLRLPRLDMYYYQQAGTIEAWGEPAFARRLAWIRARRRVRAWVGA